MSVVAQFKIYRIWKTFKVWRRCVRAEKLDNATKTLEANLFLLDPTLSSSLCEVRTLACDMLDGEERLQLHSLTPNVVYKLEDFIEELTNQAAAAKERLLSFHGATKTSVEAACQVALTKLQEARGRLGSSLVRAERDTDRQLGRSSSFGRQATYDEE